MTTYLEKPVFVTQPFLPPLEEFQPYLQKIWESKVLTNSGPFHEQLEIALAAYLGVKYISLFSNGTLALITALQALQIRGEVITTPFSFVATTHALWWNGIKPVFVDIEPETYTLNPDKIEAAITPNTTAILPVHVYGNPCKVHQIEKIANTHGLKVIYDACHTFGAKLNGQSIVNFGDLSILSFHATKVFNTFEGGAIVCHDEKTKLHIDQLKNFGFTGETTVVAPGINAKMNEIQAAFGLLQLKYVDDSISKRKALTEQYSNLLADINGITVMNVKSGSDYNYAYYPILVNEKEFGCSRDELYEQLKRCNIFTRRYFYPLISDFPTYKALPSSASSNLTTAVSVSQQILCLPIYPDLGSENVEYIVRCLLKSGKG
jgi:dTDP-4-amino-4,6-dideoxygalactose transaminase